MTRSARQRAAEEERGTCWTRLTTVSDTDASKENGVTKVLLLRFAASPPPLTLARAAGEMCGDCCGGVFAGTPALSGNTEGADVKLGVVSNETGGLGSPCWSDDGGCCSCSCWHTISCSTVSASKHSSTLCPAKGSASSSSSSSSLPTLREAAASVKGVSAGVCGRGRDGSGGESLLPPGVLELLSTVCLLVGVACPCH